MRKYVSIFLLSYTFFANGQILLPINAKNRVDVSQIKLTEIGKYGLQRKARKVVPAHLHTGIDFKRPNNNYGNEPIFPLAEGRVISKRTDGAYAQLIIEHNLNGKKFWTLYEHIAGITVKVNDYVKPTSAIARFMNKSELDKYGWQFDHFHLEVLKIMPLKLKPDKTHPERHFGAYSLVCFTQKDLDNYYYDPIKFIRNFIKK